MRHSKFVFYFDYFLGKKEETLLRDVFFLIEIVMSQFVCLSCASYNTTYTRWKKVVEKANNVYELVFRERENYQIYDKSPALQAAARRVRGIYVRMEVEGGTCAGGAGSWLCCLRT